MDIKSLNVIFILDLFKDGVIYCNMDYKITESTNWIGEMKPLKGIFKIKFLDERAMISKTHDSDACWDVVACSKKDYGDGRIEYGLGFSSELPKGTQLDIRARSSIHKTGMILSNGIGTGDEDYRGEYKVVFYHVIKDLPPYEIGDRVAQFQLVERSEEGYLIDSVDELSDTERGEGGFGSTGN